jgi:hypothetical protein
VIVCRSLRSTVIAIAREASDFSVCCLWVVEQARHFSGISLQRSGITWVGGGPAQRAGVVARGGSRLGQRAFGAAWAGLLGFHAVGRSDGSARFWSGAIGSESAQSDGFRDLSIGAYSQFHRVTDPRAPDYADRLQVVPYDGADRFTFGQLRANVLLRWESMPGSTAYLAWTREQTNQGDQLGVLRLDRDLANVFRNRSIDAVQMKLMHWFSL